MTSRKSLLIPASFVLLLATILFSLSLGRYAVPLPQIIRIVGATLPFGAAHDYADKPWIVIELVRMPRILLASLCGLNLALAGAAMQGVFRNPLVGPEVCGVQAGASFGGVAAIMLGLPAAGAVGLAFLGGMGALVAAFGLTRLAKSEGPLGLVLAGVIVGAFFGALVGLMQYFANPLTKLPTIVYWLLGSLAGATDEKVLIVGAVTLVAGGLLLALRWRINLLSLGEDEAASLGVKVDVLRWCVVGLVALLVAAQVSVSGGVGWVGLIVPHVARMLAGPEHARLMPVSAFLGGFYLLAMDDLARSATGQEIPIGLLTAVVGAPVFAIMFWRLQSKGWTGA
jgi:iron complex transport system permease protein